MDDEANREADKASWTIKSVSTETRKLAVACAAKSGDTMAESGERVLPPLRVPRGHKLVPAVAPTPGAVDMKGLAGLLGAVQGMAAAAGVPIPPTTARHALALLRDQLRAARGLPVLPRKQTRPKNGQTISVEQKE